MWGYASKDSKIRFEMNRAPITIRNTKNEKVTFFFHRILTFFRRPKIRQRYVYSATSRCVSYVLPFHPSASLSECYKNPRFWHAQANLLNIRSTAPESREEIHIKNFWNSCNEYILHFRDIWRSLERFWLVSEQFKLKIAWNLIQTHRRSRRTQPHRHRSGSLATGCHEGIGK